MTTFSFQCYTGVNEVTLSTRWRHQMETFSASLVICVGNSPAPGEFPTQRPETWSFDASFNLRPNKRLSKQSRCWWFETPSRPLWRNCNVMKTSGYSPTKQTTMKQWVVCRLLHSPTLLAVELSVGYETLPPTGSHLTFCGLNIG